MANVIDKVYNYRELEKSVIEEFYSEPIKPGFRRPTFCIVIPPPNVTGSLHMGHALNSTIQDFLIRYKLLRGFDSVWFIGTDHAGIATQTVVEKHLLKQGIKRTDLSKEEFVQKIWEWKNEYGNIILEQFKRLGIYADISSARFTMDELYSYAVKKAFVELFNRGYVYKGKRVVNWCPRCLTSLSDLEVVHKPTKTKLWYVRYKLADSDDYLVVATTRPETIIADTALAVNPKDSRYLNYVGKFVMVPIVNRAIPVITSDQVDVSFGTGVLKVTPAHDFNDYKIYQKHKNIGIINIFNPRGELVLDNIPERENVSKYHGMDRFNLRENFVKDLESLGLLEKVEDYLSNIGYCYRCDTIIEPYYSDQWFISMRELVKKPLELVKQDKIKFYPNSYKKVVIDWYENIEDWCVSRQIFWGHKIPVYTCRSCQEMWASEKDEYSCPKCGSKDIYQEEDVLDTWFSSAIWPFAVMYWPDKKFEEYKKYYYPTDVLTTAREIVFLWVSRMIVMSVFFLDEIPFRDVIIHAVILAPSGKRMSKSLGTGIDPLELIDKYGADAVRMGLIIQTAESQDVKFSIEKIEMAGNFINKLWNAIRYFEIRKNQKPNKILDPRIIRRINNWLIYELTDLSCKLENYANEYRFFDYCMSLYHFVWNVFCDWYIEFSKLFDYSEIEKTVDIVIKSILLYLHPIIPFVTSYLYRKLYNQDITQEDVNRLNEFLKREFVYNKKDYEDIKNLINSIKEVRPFVNEILQLGFQNSVKVKVNFQEAQELLEIFYNFTKTIEGQGTKSFVIKTNLGNVNIYLEEETISKYKELLRKKMNEINNNIRRIENLFANKDFIEKADKEVIKNYSIELQRYRDLLEINSRILEEL
ncbi:MAG: valine--tRNA ligase [Candidatus Calescibacterium sp.]|nr:valine--tRNA ligase [Candidatus Calescibacterium sp.]MCX7972285.1 valine--tRNA ligase [bacterium]MDW8195112.1 valine--tRNA ligase [Candidatus Calescibacterium sp.]